MSTRYSSVSRPAVVYPDHHMSLEDMLGMAERVYGDLSEFPVIQRMIQNTQISQRHFALPLDQLGAQTGLGERGALYMEHARPLARRVVSEALDEVGLEPGEIDLIITTSCTGFVMPSLDAYLMNDVGFRPTTRRMPLAQLGCVGGVSALSQANNYCRVHPRARVLVLAVELSSLCFFPEHVDLTSAVCASIFGDGAAACVVEGAERDGFALQLGESLSYTVPNSEHYIRYEVTDGGYHLTLDRAVMRAVPKLAPVIAEFVRAQHGEQLDFVVAHTGGPRILDGIARSLDIDIRLLESSRASLREAGNTASVSVFDVLRRAYTHERLERGARGNHGIVVAFGPGFTMELLDASWIHA